MKEIQREIATFNLRTQTITIDGTEWFTRTELMRRMKIKKSLFYMLIEKGEIEVRSLFTDTYFHIYRTTPAYIDLYETEGGML